MFEFIETPFFTKALDRYLDDDEYQELQAYLSEHPESGKIVPGSGGIRKLRWGTAGRGKRGGGFFCEDRLSLGNSKRKRHLPLFGAFFI